MDFAGHGHEQLLPGVHHNILSGSPRVCCTDSPSIQVKIRLLPQVGDILLDQCREWTVSDIDPIINRPPEAVALCGKCPTLCIIQKELQHGRVLYGACEVCSDLCFADEGVQSFEEL